MKPRKALEKWHKKALMIDTRKTRLVIERENADSENATSCIDKSQLNLAVPDVQSSLTHDLDSLEEP